jgi:PilZ domain
VASSYFIAALMTAIGGVRAVERRSEARQPADPRTAVLEFRGVKHIVRLVNVSNFGAMVLFGHNPNIGERLTLQLLDRGAVPSQVRWVKDGRVGLCFASPRN